MDISLSRQATLLLILICIACQALVAPSAVSAHGEMSRGALPQEVRGTYRLTSGNILTFTGQQGMPSYELGGERVFVRPSGDDRFTAWDDPGEALILERDTAGHVTGLVLVRDGETIARGTKVELYSEQDIMFSNGGVSLAGSVLLPEGASPHPAVVIVHGAEFATRESYRLLASQFARRGVAALIYDKRGVGESGGSFRGATFDDLVGDALAGFDLLRKLPAVDPQRVGMLGLSQGGWVIALAGAASDDVAFLIPISASGFSPAVQDRWLNGNIIAHRQLRPAVNRSSERAWRMLLSTRDLVDAGLMAPMPDLPGFWFHALDPNLDTAGMWQSVRQPLLGVWGEFDCQLPAYDSLAAVKNSLDAGGHGNYTLVVQPGADHSLSLVPPCAQETTGWSVLRYDYPEGYFGMLAGWVHQQAADTGPIRQVIQPDQPTPSTLAWHQAPTAGIGMLGSFVPQMAMMMGLIAMFGVLVGVSLARSVVSVLRRRPGQPTMLGTVALLGLVAMLLGIASLTEMLLLGSPDGAPMIGDAPVFGVTPVFAMAGATVTGTVLLGIVAFVRSPDRSSARSLLTFTALTGLAAWSSYWALPVWMLLA